MIPKIIHYFWAGGEENHPNFRQRWKELHPGWIIQRWDDQNIIIDNDYLKNAFANNNWAKVSDYVRLWALWKFGGVYLDTDVELVKPLDDLLGWRFFCGFQCADPARYLNSAVLGAEPSHISVILMCAKLMNGFSGLEQDDSTGPGVITEYFRNVLSVNMDVEQDFPLPHGGVALGKSRFYPYTWAEKFDPKCVRAGTYGIHHWDLSWWQGRATPFQTFNPFGS
jgi:hypothetical protein